MYKWVITRNNSIKYLEVYDHNNDFFYGKDNGFYRKSKSFDSESETKEFLINWANKKIKRLNSNLFSLKKLIEDLECL
jgi:hypothetical protein